MRTDDAHIEPGREREIAVVGAGSIGVAWAIVFACAGFRVALHDADAQRLDAALGELGTRLRDLERFALLAEAPCSIAERVEAAPDLRGALARAAHVQECVPEQLDVKRALFATLAQLAPADATLASSSSAITASAFASELAARDRCLVVHPANPPYLLPVAEVVPAPFTRPDVVARTEALLAQVGMATVRVRREVEGFVFNRLQGAVLREAYCLVRDGVATVEDVDRVMRDGLGRRWSVIGPFETVDLNTRGGIEAHAELLGPAYARMGAERGQHDPWTPELVDVVAAQRRERLPLECWAARVAWRDRALMTLERARAAIEPFPPAGDPAARPTRDGPPAGAAG